MKGIVLILLLAAVNGLPTKNIPSIQENPCEDVSPLDNVLLPNPNDFASFIQCVDHWPLVILCPEGQHFSAGATKCESKSLKNNNTNPCEGVSEEEDVLLPNPANCSTFIQCVHQEPVVRDCPKGMEWSIEMTRCDYPWLAKCNSTGEIYKLFRCENVPDHLNVLLPNYKDCGSYIQCIHQKPEIIHCPEGLHWSTEKQKCDLPFISKCNSPNETLQNCENVPENMKVLLPNPDDCGSYIQCIHQKPEVIYCPHGLHWSVQRQRCDYKSVAECLIEKRKTLCEDVPAMKDVLLQNPEDCRSYIQCENEKPVVRLCPEGLHFSPTRRRCEWPNIAQCEMEINP